MYQSVDVAAISFRPKKFDLADNADRLEAMFRAAAKGGAQLALAPEGVLEGYVVMELITKEEPEERMRDVAVTTRRPGHWPLSRTRPRVGNMPRLWASRAHRRRCVQLRRLHRPPGPPVWQVPQNAVGRRLPSLLVVQPPRCPCPRL